MNQDLSIFFKQLFVNSKLILTTAQALEGRLVRSLAPRCLDHASRPRH